MNEEIKNIVGYMLANAKEPIVVIPPKGVRGVSGSDVEFDNFNKFTFFNLKDLAGVMVHLNTNGHTFTVQDYNGTSQTIPPTERITAVHIERDLVTIDTLLDDNELMVDKCRRLQAGKVKPPKTKERDIWLSVGVVVVMLIFIWFIGTFK